LDCYFHGRIGFWFFFFSMASGEYPFSYFPFFIIFKRKKDINY
jgi:hypothetical protein